MELTSLLGLGLALLLAPLLSGIINRVKAMVGGRKGVPLLQLYIDLGKLLRKGVVYSRTTTLFFRLSPLVSVAALVVALGLLPLGGWPSLIAFEGDLVLMVYLLGTVRLLTVLAALDTGSPFQGMGASREVQFAVLAEPAFFLAVLALARASGTWELAGVLGGTPLPGVTTILVAATLTAVLLCENSRIPVDDPNTHLELTMIHEVMVLDHSGPDLAMILYASSLKLWLYAAIMVGALLPVSTLPPAMVLPVWLAALFAVAVVVGLVESAMARLRLLHMPRLLAGAAILSLVAVFWG